MKDLEDFLSIEYVKSMDDALIWKVNQLQTIVSIKSKSMSELDMKRRDTLRIIEDIEKHLQYVKNEVEEYRLLRRIDLKKSGKSVTVSTEFSMGQKVWTHWWNDDATRHIVYEAVIKSFDIRIYDSGKFDVSYFLDEVGDDDSSLCDFSRSVDYIFLTQEEAKEACKNQNHLNERGGFE